MFLATIAQETDNNWFFFNLSSEDRENSRIRNFEIKYYINPDDLPEANFTVEFSVYLNKTISIPGVGQSSRLLAIRLSRIPVSPDLVRRNNGWMTIIYPTLRDITERWLTNPETNYGIKLEALNHPSLIATGVHPQENGFVSTMLSHTVQHLNIQSKHFLSNLVSNAFFCFVRKFFYIFFLDIKKRCTFKLPQQSIQN